MGLIGSLMGKIRSGRERPVDIVKLVSMWEEDSYRSRDESLNALLGPRFRGSFGGMEGVVRTGHNYYTPRNWENPPYNKLGVELSDDYLVYPYYFSIVQNKLPVVIPSDISLTALPLDSNEKGFSAMATSILDEEQEHLDFYRKVQSAVLGAWNHGSQIVFFGHSTRRGTMNIDRTMEVCDPLSVLVDPFATSLDDAKYIIYKRWRLVDDIMSEYDLPDSKRPSSRVIDRKYSTLLTLSGEGLYSDHSERCVETLVWIRDTSIRRVAETELVESVIFDDSGNLVDDVIESEVLDDSGNRKLVSMANYPNGRFAVIINDDLIWDGPNPYDHKRCPFLKLDNHILPYSFWGLPEWYTIGDIAQIVNEGVSSLQRNSRDTTSKVLINPDAIEGDIDEITTDPREFIRLKEGLSDSRRIWERIEIGGMNMQNIQSVNMALQIGEITSGVTDASRGVSDSNVTSGRQQALLSDMAERRMVVFSRQVSDFLSKAAYLMLHNAIQFRSPQDVIDIALNANTHETISLEDFPRNVEFKTKFVAASSLPTDRQERLKVLDSVLDRMFSIYNAFGYEAAKVYIDASDINELGDMLEAIHMSSQSKISGDGLGDIPPQVELGINQQTQ